MLESSAALSPRGVSALGHGSGAQAQMGGTAGAWRPHILTVQPARAPLLRGGLAVVGFFHRSKFPQSTCFQTLRQSCKAAFDLATLVRQCYFHCAVMIEGACQDPGLGGLHKGVNSGRRGSWGNISGELAATASLLCGQD